MKRYTLLIALMFLVNISSIAQMVLTHTYGLSTAYSAEVVNLSRSGKKIAVMRMQGTVNTADTIFYYNPDYSLWKMIPCPAITGYVGQFEFGPKSSASQYVCYSSETLFNTDTFLEAAVSYNSYPSGSAKLYIINENGTLTDSISNTLIADFKVQAISSGVFVATLRSSTGLQVYQLPGTLPCDICSDTSTSGMSLNIKQPKNFPTEPMPNPSSNEVKITFTLPDGVSQGELNLYNTNGQQLRSYKVDNRFGFILLDNSQLAPGVYFYNIVVNGAVSTTQKMVVIK